MSKQNCRVRCQYAGPRHPQFGSKMSILEFLPDGGHVIHDLDAKGEWKKSSVSFTGFKHTIKFPLIYGTAGEVPGGAEDLEKLFYHEE